MENVRQRTYYMINKMIDNANLDLTFSTWGIASRIENEIILNLDLLSYPDLCYNIVSHEIAHSGGFTLSDFFTDLAVRQSGLWSFVLRHPKTLSQFIPAGYRKGYMWADWTMLILYAVMGASAWILLTIK